MTTPATQAVGWLVPQLSIDWASMPTYNTVMSVAAGAGLLGLVVLGRDLSRDPGSVSTDGWALNFGVLGLLLAPTGLHMTLTWPLASGGFPFDNIIFGEPALAFGVLLLAAALLLWRRGAVLHETADPVALLARTVRPLSLLVLGLGLSCFAIAVAGVRYQLFAAPPQEPISGEFAAYPMVEAVFISGIYAVIGLGAVLAPLAARGMARGGVPATAKAVGVCWAAGGLVLLLFGALNYFTHIGLIVNTM